MARKKLKSFTVDEAGDTFTPTVKTIKANNAVSEQQNDEHQTKLEKDEEAVNAIEKEHVVETVAEKPADEVESKEKIHNEKSDEKQIGEELIQLVGFFLGEEEFGVDIQKIQEINRMVDITRVPNTSECVMGVINLRGKVVPVISLRERFGLAEKECDTSTRIVVVEIEGKIIGLLVDSVSEVLRIPASTIEPPPPIVAGINAEFIEGVGKLDNRLLILLDLDKLLYSKEIREMRKVA